MYIDSEFLGVGRVDHVTAVELSNDRVKRSAIALFDSIGEYTNYLSDEHLAEHIEFGDDWCGRADLENPADWRKKMDLRWNEGLETISQYRELIADQLSMPEAKTRTRTWSHEFGTEFSFDRWRNGDGCFSDFPRKHEQQDTVVIAIKCNASANVAASNMMRSGAVGVVIAEVLEDMGVRCEVWAVTYSQNVYIGGGNALTGVKIKDAGEPNLDLVRVCNAVSPWNSRVGIFAAKSMIPQTHWHLKFGECCASQGQPMRFHADICEYFRKPNCPLWIVDGILNDREAVCWIKEKLKSLDGVQV